LSEQFLAAVSHGPSSRGQKNECELHVVVCDRDVGWWCTRLAVVASFTASF
jgi:hypothetical protein